MRTKREYVQAIYQRYRTARRPEKRRILDEFCQVVGYHRKHAIRVLNGLGPAAARAPRRRAPTYSPAVIEALQAIWAAAGFLWSLRLKALLPVWLPWARRRLRLRPAVERQLLAISPRQIDRRLAPHRRQLIKRLYGRVPHPVSWTREGDTDIAPHRRSSILTPLCDCVSCGDIVYAAIAAARAAVGVL